MDIQYWLEYFQQNSCNRPTPDWNAPIKIDASKLPKLRKSLQQFQLGDGGGPAYLIAWNYQSLFDKSPKIKNLVDLWFKEEKEHSRLLGEALKRFDGEEITTHWSFELFCGVRKVLGVQFELYVLLVTEIVSNVYYKMLYKYCSDRPLRDMCRLIIRDEVGHIAFHQARLVSEAQSKTRYYYGLLWEIMFRGRALIAGTVLWVNHGSTLIALGGSTPQFYRAIWRDMGKFISRLRSQTANLEATKG